MESRIAISGAGVVPRLLLLLGAAVITASASGCSGASSSAGGGVTTLPGPLQPASGVVGMVQGKVSGLSPMQTAQGMGGILGYAKTKLPAAQFAKVASAFPGSEAMMSEGRKLGMPSEMTGITSLKGTLGNAGISADQYSQMVPAMADVVSEKAGPDVAQAFSALFR